MDVLDESQLNVYVLDSNLSPRQKERLQAQVLTALRSLPPWMFGLLTRRLDTDKVANTARLAFNTAWLLANDDDRLPAPKR